MRSFLSLLALILFSVTSPASERTNVIVFFVDDLGWTDLACYGSDFYETPNIDRLAEEGVKFSQAYSACTVCSPSRAALLTGQYPARLRITDFIPGHPVENTPLTIPKWKKQLDLEKVTIAEILRDAGYRTAHFGKWHLTPRQRTANPNDDGNFPDFYPDKQGFEFNFGGCERGAPASYYWPYGRGKTVAEKKKNNTFRTLPSGEKAEGRYLTDHLADEAIRIIAEFGNDPFFIYFPFYNVHTPIQGRPDLVAKYEAKLKANPEVRHRNVGYAAMVESVDEAIGRVMTQLEKQGISDRTLVIFSSDNGGLRPQATDNAPLRQGKGSIYEGGIRVPTIIRWPGTAKAGSTCDIPVITVDFFPTVLEAAGVKVPSEVSAIVDGVSLVKMLGSPGESDLGRDAIFWHYPHYHSMGAVPYSAVRVGGWKLIERHDGALVELYHLAKDIREDRNLAEVQPERAAEMRKRLDDWREAVGAQMPTKNADFDPGKPTGIKRGKSVREIAPVRE